MYYILYFFLDNLALHASGDICTHHQEHNCSVQPSSGVEVYLHTMEVYLHTT
jgi:hypothetical protein